MEFLISEILAVFLVKACKAVLAAILIWLPGATAASKFCCCLAILSSELSKGLLALGLVLATVLTSATAVLVCLVSSLIASVLAEVSLAGSLKTCWASSKRFWAISTCNLALSSWLVAKISWSCSADFLMANKDFPGVLIA